MPRDAGLTIVRAFLAGALLLAAGGRIHCEEWPEFRGPSGQGYSSTAGLPVEWSPERNITWRKPIAGKGWSSPIFFGARLYLTTAVETEAGGGQSLRALCLDATTGQIQWNVELFREPAGSLPPIHAKNSYASSTPITDGERLYVHFGPNGAAALGLDGSVIWTNRDIHYDARHGGGGSPILAGRALIFNCDGVERPYVVALDRLTGRELWRTPRPDMEPERFSFSTPLAIEVNGRQQVVSPGSHFVCSYDPNDGREIWRVGYPNKWSVIPRPVYSHGMVFVCTGYEGPAELLAIRPDGERDVTETHVAWRRHRFVPYTPSPLVVGNAIFTVSDGGIAACCDIDNGVLHWSERLGGNFSASPLYAGGNVYFPNEEGECFVVRATKDFQLVAKNDLQEPTFASYAVGNGALFVRTAEALYRIDAADSDAGPRSTE